MRAAQAARLRIRNQEHNGHGRRPSQGICGMITRRPACRTYNPTRASSQTRGQDNPGQGCASGAASRGDPPDLAPQGQLTMGMIMARAIQNDTYGEISQEELADLRRVAQRCTFCGMLATVDPIVS